MTEDSAPAPKSAFDIIITGFEKIMKILKEHKLKILMGIIILIFYYSLMMVIDSDQFRKEVPDGPMKKKNNVITSTPIEDMMKDKEDEISVFNNNYETYIKPNL
tara:strand:- start:5310 stop:5621 length:312 start_codon:yes stop_codon:yes gene_type:complete